LLFERDQGLCTPNTIGTENKDVYFQQNTIEATYFTYQNCEKARKFQIFTCEKIEIWDRREVE